MTRRDFDRDSVVFVGTLIAAFVTILACIVVAALKLLAKNA